MFLIREFDKPIAQIAGEIGCTKKTLQNWLKIWHFPKRKARIKGSGRPLKENPGYASIHTRIKQVKPKPHECELCGKWRCRMELSNKDHKYSVNPDDYQWLCKSCHTKYDNKKFKSRLGRRKFPR